MKNLENSWSCINNCGACCYLAPEERSEALKFLTSKQTLKYLSMVGPDGWCINYDTGSRRCKIYEQRPDFCRVSNFNYIFKLEFTDANMFAIKCCRQHIKSKYGGRSLVMKRFNRKVREVAKDKELNL